MRPPSAGKGSPFGKGKGKGGGKGKGKGKGKGGFGKGGYDEGPPDYVVGKQSLFCGEY
jgi:hypothetical protein